MEKLYVETVRLLLQTAPEVFRVPAFALKGGTALNLFVQDMPRLSVDLDVVYADHLKTRAEALNDIASGLAQARTRLEARGIEVELRMPAGGEETKLFVRRLRSLVKVEVNHVFRGTLLPVETRRLVKATRDLFTTDLSVSVLALPELYGSKLVAALDRQHPRDLYDVRAMYEKLGLTVEMIECFVCYLAGHNRPIHEVLFSRDQDMRPAFEGEFQGMTREPISLAELNATRERLRRDLVSRLTTAQRQFLISVAMVEPEWHLVGFPHLQELPALKWKLQNLQKLAKSNPTKLRQQADDLRSRLS
jgi:predicted nucleotidyltransferase component of viral defense system